MIVKEMRDKIIEVALMAGDCRSVTDPNWEEQ